MARTGVRPVTDRRTLPDWPGSATVRSNPGQKSTGQKSTGQKSTGQKSTGQILSSQSPAACGWAPGPPAGPMFTAGLATRSGA